MGLIDSCRAIKGLTLDSILGCRVSLGEEHGLLNPTTGLGVGAHCSFRIDWVEG